MFQVCSTETLHSVLWLPGYSEAANAVSFRLSFANRCPRTHFDFWNAGAFAARFEPPCRLGPPQRGLFFPRRHLSGGWLVIGDADVDAPLRPATKLCSII
jgi:hypothetical protein